ncbi:unnamed protein product [Musa acuminata subsp. malaccensis]|uniref:(wild Malaysian banana) hypothetical protein n=1 Tax=Musa acuminata subsp. malaccensis TaxID=214687 RepID=A0A804IDV2_MUSAM|nr:unnamed protein product [Musa acuminata subsp. malaccensis]
MFNIWKEPSILPICIFRSRNHIPIDQCIDSRFAVQYDSNIYWNNHPPLQWCYGSRQ